MFIIIKLIFLSLDDGVANGSHFQSEENIKSLEVLREVDVETEIKTRRCVMPFVWSRPHVTK
jgi:hypothetical protein